MTVVSASESNETDELFDEDGKYVCSLSMAFSLQAKIRNHYSSFVSSAESLHAAINEAKECQVWKSFNRAAGKEVYASWSDYLAQILKDAPKVKLPVEQRRELVGLMTREGMSTRAQGAVLGVSNRTVANDQEATVQNYTVEPTTEDDVVEAEIVEEKITGMNGKKYERPKKQELSPQAKAAKEKQQLLKIVNALFAGVEKLQDFDPKYLAAHAAQINRMSEVLDNIKEEMQ